MWITVGRTIVHNRGRAKERDFRSFRFEGIERLRNRRRWIYDVDGIPLERRAFDFFLLLAIFMSLGNVLAIVVLSDIVE